MNLTELSELLSSATDVLRVETLDAYSSPSDADYLARFRAGEPKPDPSEKQPWLDRLAAAAERGHPWRRLRVVTRPVSEYVKYSAEFGYIDNVTAGEDVRVLDPRFYWVPGLAEKFARHGDFYALPAIAETVVMDYDRDGRFIEAHAPDDGMVDDYLLDLAEEGWTYGMPFAEWWAANPDLHRDLTAV